MSDGWRWKAACHEAGHAVAISCLTGNEAFATLLDSGGGFTLSQRGSLSLFRDAVAAAIGPVAAKLAESHPEPSEATTKRLNALADQLPECSRQTPEEQATYSRWYAEQWTTDDDIRRRYVFHAGWKPRWGLRQERVDRAAAKILREHEIEILGFATALYARGWACVGQKAR